MIFLRRQLPLLITMVTGLVMAAQYYVPHPASEQLLTSVTKWLQIIGGFALGLGITSLFHAPCRENPAQGSGVGIQPRALCRHLGHLVRGPVEWTGKKPSTGP